MAISGCVQCWETPCKCGREYKNMTRENRIQLASVVLNIDEKILTELIQDFLNKNGYVSITKVLPNDGEKVYASFKGVYEDRLVTFWLDHGDNPHFGAINEADGKGVQSATHWRKI